MLPTTYLSFVLLSVASLVTAGTVTYEWDATWVRAAPDGFDRPLIGINGHWPCPPINANVGDTVIVKLNNLLGNETTGLHFHGIDQIHTGEMDGPSGVTQCPVPPGSSITYNFVVDRPGTYWYHSHNMGQYPDGLRGPLIVHDPLDPYKAAYDEEVILTISDWYRSESISLVRNMLQASNTNFLPPFPDTLIVNEGGDGKINFVKGKTYRIRIISFSAFASAQLHFDSHTMQVIMTDGTYTQKEQAYQLRISPAQRYDVLVSCIDRDNRNYPFLVSLDINRDYTKPNAVYPHNFTGHLVMDPNKPFTVDTVNDWRPVDDSHFKPLLSVPRFEPVTTNIVLDFEFCSDKNGIPRACFNGKPYIQQKVPSLYTAATTGNSNTNPAIYGDVNPYVVSFGEVVQIVINNKDPAIHPFHLHGHQFQVLDRPRSDTGPWPGRGSGAAIPPSRDVVHVMANSHAVLRFRATNPGVFLFHCHIEWHVEMGLTATIIEAPELLRGRTFPADHINNCKIQNIPYAGNAAGNKDNYTDTTGFNTDPDPVYNGALYFPPPARSRTVRKRL